jgi:tetratricopeptide (TPR) repeat protein
LEVTFVISTSVFFILEQSHAAGETEINHLNEVTHLEMQDIAPADYVLKRTGDKLELNVDALGEATKKKLTAYSDRFIKKIEIQKNTSLSKDIITFHLADKDLEVFDYLTDAPSSLSLDFFAKEDKETDAEYEMAQKLIKKETRKKSVSGTAKASGANASRDIASSEFIQTIGHVTITGDTEEVKDQAKSEEEKTRKKKEVNAELLRIIRLAKQDAGDILKFDTDKLNFSKDSLIEGKNKIYIKYPVLLNEHKYISEILQKNIQYEIKEAKDDISKDFLKIRKFYTNGDYKNFLKSKKIYQRRHPSSKYEEMITYMEADAYLELYKTEKEKSFFDRSLKIYDSLLSKYPDSQISERTLLLVAYLRLKDQQYFEASRNLKNYTVKYEKSPLRDNIELILAQSLVRLHEYGDAKKIYSQLFKSDNHEIQASAHYEYGNIYFEEKDYLSAISAYETALKLYPNEDKNHENIYFNLGETQFLVGDYKSSLNYLRKFIANHPQHEFASYAWTRMGEIFELSEVDPKIWKGYYNESHFRFHNYLGGALAKINLLYHQAIGDKKKFDYLIDQIRKFENQIPLKQANEYIAFKISDAYYEVGKYSESTQTLVNQFKAGQMPEHAEKFHKRIGRGLAAQLRSAVEQKKVVVGMSLFDETDPLWLKKSERFDFSFYKGELFRAANLCAKALKQYEIYLADFAKVPKKEELDKSQRLPYLSEVYLKSSICLNQLDQQTKAQEMLSKVDPTNLMPQELDDYYLLQADIATKNVAPDEALKFLAKIQNQNISTLNKKIDILNEKGLTKDSLSSIDSFMEGNSLSEKDRFNLLRKKLSILETSKDKKMPQFLQSFYEEFKDKSFDFDREKYLLYGNLVDEKKMKEAEDVFSKIKSESYWAKLAAEKKTSAQWGQKYQKFVDRIPAMQKPKESIDDKNSK